MEQSNETVADSHIWVQTRTECGNNYEQFLKTKNLCSSECTKYRQVLAGWTAGCWCTPFWQRSSTYPRTRGYVGFQECPSARWNPQIKSITSCWAALSVWSTLYEPFHYLPAQGRSAVAFSPGINAHGYTYHKISVYHITVYPHWYQLWKPNHSSIKCTFKGHSWTAKNP